MDAQTEAPRRARGQRLRARISAEQKALFQHAADLQGRTLADFVIASVQDAAARTVKEMETIRVAMEHGEAFARAMLDSSPPNQALKEGLKRYRARAVSK